LHKNIIDISKINLLELFGIHEKKLNFIRNIYPELKIILRGSNLQVQGNQDEVDKFIIHFNLMLQHFDKYSRLTENNIENIILNIGAEILDVADDILVYGPRGGVVKARTHNQRKMADSITKNDILFAVGPAGTGKTYTAVALAVRALRKKEVKKIILTRPAVEAGEHIGFLPGDVKDKLDPYLQPLYDALRDMIDHEKLAEHLETGIIQIAPLGFMRGRTLDNAYVILDEGQNTTKSQIKMFLSRMGKSAKFLITGDITQVDLPKHQTSGLETSINLLKNIEGIDIIFLDESDVIRHSLVKEIIKAFKNT
jgi:phosphate starvation-inducible PhoH-like protein